MRTETETETEDRTWLQAELEWFEGTDRQAARWLLDEMAGGREVRREWLDGYCPRIAELVFDLAPEDWGQDGWSDWWTAVAQRLSCDEVRLSQNIDSLVGVDLPDVKERLESALAEYREVEQAMREMGCWA